MTTANNAMNVTLSGKTGTGSFAGSTSATFTTPTLGVITATSINFGGGALGTYTSSTTWTPTFTFVTPGTVSVGYIAQVGKYLRIGGIVFFYFELSFTMTNGTASGNAIIGGFPVTVNSTPNIAPYIKLMSDTTSVTYNTGDTEIHGLMVTGSTTMNIAFTGSTKASSLATPTNMTGSTYTFLGSGWYAT